MRDVRRARVKHELDLDTAVLKQLAEQTEVVSQASCSCGAGKGDVACESL